jgi:hypothetical protein
MEQRRDRKGSDTSDKEPADFIGPFLFLLPFEHPLIGVSAAPGCATKNAFLGVLDPVRTLLQPGRWESGPPGRRERAPRRAPLIKNVIAAHGLSGLRCRTGTIFGTRIDSAALGDMTARVLPAFADIVPVKTKL